MYNNNNNNNTLVCTQFLGTSALECHPASTCIACLCHAAPPRGAPIARHRPPCHVAGQGPHAARNRAGWYRQVYTAFEAGCLLLRAAGRMGGCCKHLAPCCAVASRRGCRGCMCPSAGAVSSFSRGPTRGGDGSILTTTGLFTNAAVVYSPQLLLQRQWQVQRCVAASPAPWHA